MTGSLIDDTADYWKSKGVQVRQWLDDDNGRYAFRIAVQFHETEPAQSFFVTARTGMRTPLGAMKKLVARTANNDALLLVRVGDKDRAPAFYVFDPLTILKHGQDNTAADHREGRGEKWVDFHPDWGVNLWNYADGSHAPAGPDDDVVPLPDDEDDDADPSGGTLDDYV